MLGLVHEKKSTFRFSTLITERFTPGEPLFSYRTCYFGCTGFDYIVNAINKLTYKAYWIILLPISPISSREDTYESINHYQHPDNEATSS